MSWVDETKRTWPEWAAIRMLKVGPIPNHLALIMDGNRRFARRLNKETLEGHSQGFKKLAEMLSWCKDLGITEVTVYAFSIENFKRSKYEVDGLIHLAEEKFKVLLKEVDKLREHGVCIRVIGNISLFSLRLKSLIAQAMLATKDNEKCYLNLAMAYTSRDEMSMALYKISSGLEAGKLKTADVTENLIDKCLHTNSSSIPDLLIRTSGERRLSDFLLWQTSFTHIVFTNVLWPEITLWHVLGSIFQYQRQFHTLTQFRKDAALRGVGLQDELPTSKRIEKFVEGIERENSLYLQSLILDDSSGTIPNYH